MREHLFPEPWMRWYDLPGLRRMALARYAFRRKGWHPRRRRLARLRALYWVLLRGHETEICCRHGGPVGVVFHVPDELWGHHSGFERAARTLGGEAGGGVLCVDCFDALYRESGEGYLCWTCATDDSVMVG